MVSPVTPDAQVKTAVSTAASVSSATLTHKANALVLVGWIGSQVASANLSSVTIGGAAATKSSQASDGLTLDFEVWWAFRASAATESVVVKTQGVTTTMAWSALSYINSSSLGTGSFFEATTGGNRGIVAGSTTGGISVTVASGTSNRRLIMFAAGTNATTAITSMNIVPGAGQTERSQASLVSSNARSLEVSDELGDSTTTMLATVNASAAGSLIIGFVSAFAILPQSIQKTDALHVRDLVLRKTTRVRKFTEIILMRESINIQGPHGLFKLAFSEAVSIMEQIPSLTKILVKKVRQWLSLGHPSIHG